MNSFYKALFFFTKKNESTKITINTWFNGCLGSHNDEERSEMRYVMRIAESSESSNLWTQLALPLRGVCLLECLFIPTPTKTPPPSISFNKGLAGWSCVLDQMGAPVACLLLVKSVNRT